MKKILFIVTLCCLMVTTASAKKYLYTYSGAVGDNIETYIQTNTCPTFITPLNNVMKMEECGETYYIQIIDISKTAEYTDYVLKNGEEIFTLRICKTIAYMVRNHTMHIFTN